VLSARALLQARHARLATREFLALEDAELIARAVDDERQRLAADTDRQLRSALEHLADAADGALQDPHADLGAAARTVHRASREATVELRRQLGLLRTAAPSPATGHATTIAGPAFDASDLVIAVGTVVLALAEGAGWFELEPYAGRASAVTTALAAATVVGWRPAPVPTALTAGAVWLAAALLGVPVLGGLWVLVSFGLTGYAVVTRVAPGIAAATLVAFTALIGVATAIAEPPNVGVNLITITAATLTGLVVRLSRSRVAAARRAEEERTAALRPEIARALHAERTGFARELHDTVSHAVGVIALQAAAADVSWPSRAARSRAALTVVRDTAATALAELEGRQGAAEGDYSVADLVQRFTAAGLAVSLETDDVPSGLQPLVLRVVQEGLTNVLRHTDASSAGVTIADVGPALSIRVANGGPRLETPPTPGFGLVGLQERVELAGGTFSAGPRSAGGFQLEAIVPLERSSAWVSG
jgi:signal transduction histidine kinase